MNKFILTQLKAVLSAIQISLIITTLVLMPYPGNFSSSYAQSDDTKNLEEMDKTDGEDCDEEENQANPGQPNVYKPGCKFQKDLSKTDLKNHYSGGVKGIVEQFIGAAMAMIGVSLFIKPIPKNLKMCPQNMGSKITFPLVQAGSLAYLIGEISANASFKKASKISVDKTFGPKQDESNGNESAKEHNQKQLDAFKNLAEIYKHQQKGMKKKVQMATLAELAFIGALGVEVMNIMKMKGICTANFSALRTQTAGIVTSLQTYSTNLKTAAAAAMGAVPPLITPPQNAACLAAAAQVDTYIAGLATQDSLNQTLADTQLAISMAETHTAEVAVTLNAINITPTSNLIPAPPTHMQILQRENAEAAQNDTRAATNAAQNEAFVPAITPNCTTCTLPQCQPVIPTITGNNKVRMVPIHCCGGESQVGQNLNSPVPVNPVPEADTDDDSPAGTTTTYKLNRDKKFYVKVIIENVLRRIAMEKMFKKHPTDPKKELQQFTAMNKYIDYILENQNAIIEESNIKKELSLQKEKYGEESKEFQDYLLSTISKLKEELTIKSAQASMFKELLNIGAKATLLYFTLGSWLRQNAFPKPKTRAYTWGAMAVVNGAILMFNKKSLSKAKSRYETVLEEAEKFKNSHALKTSWDIAGDLAKSRAGKTVPAISMEGITGGVKDMACAKPVGNSFTPAQCPSQFNSSALKIPKAPASSGITGGLTGKALDLISDTATQAAQTGLADSSTSAIDGNLKKLEGMRNALSNRNKKLIEAFDKSIGADKDIKLAANDRRGKAKPVGLGRLISSVKTSPLGTPAPASMFAPSKADEEKAKKLEEENKTQLANVPKFNLPKTNSLNFNNSDFSGSDSNAVNQGELNKGAQDLAQYDLNGNDINDNSTGSIFQMISNRYIRSYPVLLDEIKDNESDAPIEP